MTDRAEPREEVNERVTHGRHCPCSACKREDWTRPELGPCGMHGEGCPAVYAPLPSAAGSSVPDTSGREKAYVVFSYGDPMPMTVCRTAELAEAYAAALARLPKDHPLYTADALVDELPLLSELPEPLRNPEAQKWEYEL